MKRFHVGSGWLSLSLTRVSHSRLTNALLTYTIQFIKLIRIQLLNIPIETLGYKSNNNFFLIYSVILLLAMFES